MTKILFAFWLTLLVSLNAYSQIWQSYKGIWLKGYDNATQAPIPPDGYSALTYFADSLGTYVYDWDSLAWLRIPGAGGGGGGLVTADNGLSVNPAGNVRLGGTLTQNTTIQGAGHNLDLGLTSSLFSQVRVFAGSASDNRASLTLSPTGGNLTNVHNGTAGRVSAFVLGDDQTFIRIDSAGISATHDVNFWKDKVAFAIEGQRYATIGAANTRFTPSSNFIVNAGSTSGNLSKATFTPTSLQLAVTDNFSFSNTFDLNPTSWNINIPTANFSANASSTIWTQGSGGQSTSIELTHSTESAELRSTQGSQLSFNVSAPQGASITFTPDNLNSTNGLDINNASTNNNASIDFQFGGTTEIAIRQGLGTNQMTIRNDAITSASGSNFTIGTSNDASVIFFEGGTSGTIILERTSGPNGTVNIFGGSGQLGTSEAGESILIRAGQGGSSGGGGGDMTIRGGSGGSAGAAGGDTYVISGQGNGGGPDGNIIIDALTGFLILSNLPTSDPCGSAPSGTVWSDSGTLKVCP